MNIKTAQKRANKEIEKLKSEGCLINKISFRDKSGKKYTFSSRTRSGLEKTALPLISFGIWAKLDSLRKQFDSSTDETEKKQIVEELTKTLELQLEHNKLLSSLEDTYFNENTINNKNELE